MSKQAKVGMTHKRGFASMSAERLRQVAKLGGIAAHAQGRAHEFTSEEARSAAEKSKSVRRRPSAKT